MNHKDALNDLIRASIETLTPRQQRLFAYGAATMVLEAERAAGRKVPQLCLIAIEAVRMFAVGQATREDLQDARLFCGVNKLGNTWSIVDLAAHRLPLVAANQTASWAAFMLAPRNRLPTTERALQLIDLLGVLAR